LAIRELIFYAGELSDQEKVRDILVAIKTALQGERASPMPQSWPFSVGKLRESKNTEVRDLAVLLGVKFGDKTDLAETQTLAKDTSAEVPRREFALDALISTNAPHLKDLLLQLINDAALRGSAIRALASFDDPTIPPRLLGLYDKLPAAEREDVLQTLASRPKFALALLDAVAAKKVVRADLNTITVRQMLALKDKQVATRVEEVWGVLRPAAKDKSALMTKYKNLLTPESLKSADPRRGHEVFTKQCAACHKLFGEGGNVGPDLTGSQRANLDYLLENILDPNAIVPKEYQATIVTTSAGRTLTGIVKEENDKALTLQTANETVVVPKDEIDSRVQSKLSMMPEGIIDRMTIDEVRALVAYLGRATPLEK
jgi:putative heme-binding domain-containing protein